jgi:hypothetical protein
MIERAEREGLLRPGDTIMQASSGNTGNAISMVAAVKGYRMLVVMPDGMSASGWRSRGELGPVQASVADPLLDGSDEQGADPPRLQRPVDGPAPPAAPAPGVST